jgi:phosphohistidine phosphatase
MSAVAVSARRATPASPVRVVLVRHGIAAERGAAYPDDSTRPLTARGAERVREVARGLVAIGVDADEILTSPFVRTRQTADLIAEAFTPRPKVTNVHALAVGGRAAAVVDYLSKLTRRRGVVLVGHAPLIGEVAAKLVGARRAIEFRKGAACCVELDALPPTRAGALRWFLPPRVLRLVGQSAPK